MRGGGGGGEGGARTQGSAFINVKGALLSMLSFLTSYPPLLLPFLFLFLFCLYLLPISPSCIHLLRLLHTEYHSKALGASNLGHLHQGQDLWSEWTVVSVVDQPNVNIPHTALIRLPCLSTLMDAIKHGRGVSAVCYYNLPIKYLFTSLHCAFTYAHATKFLYSSDLFPAPTFYYRTVSLLFRCF